MADIIFLQKVLFFYMSGNIAQMSKTVLCNINEIQFFYKKSPILSENRYF